MTFDEVGRTIWTFEVPEGTEVGIRYGTDEPMRTRQAARVAVDFDGPAFKALVLRALRNKSRRSEDGPITARVL